MEIIKNNSFDNFDPTLRLKSSPVPILFVSFNLNDKKCSYCGNKYSVTTRNHKKYCKNCLFWYIKYIVNDDKYLDILINTKNVQCIEHEMIRDANFYSNNVKKWCEYCSEVLYLNQVATQHKHDRLLICNLCEKELGKYEKEGEIINKKICLNCYLISTGWVESTFTKKLIPVIYLPWWDNTNKCLCCPRKLKFVSDCQKWCPNCQIIYTGCRYCLTTNIIFGITNQSKCKKCKRVLFITIDTTNVNIRNIEDSSINEFLDSIEVEFKNKIASYRPKYDPYDIYDFVERINHIKFIPYNQIKNLKTIAKGGFGIVHKATWLNQTIAIKRFNNSHNISKYFLNELRLFYKCYEPCSFINNYYGITKDPLSNELMIIMEYANGGDLHNYLQKYFINITWKTKLDILYHISFGLCCLHIDRFVHRDFHSGNILMFGTDINDLHCAIGDFGLSQPTNNTSSNNEIYGVIPYIAPEIFKGTKFSVKSDIYSFGMVMWELTTGCKPFTNVEHNIDLIYQIIDGKRPEITSDTPECFAKLMKKCWDSIPSKRPSIVEIFVCIGNLRGDYQSNQFKKAEKKRLELIRLKKLGPEFSKKLHSKAIFTSRNLSSLISKPSSMSSLFTLDNRLKTFNNEEYITKEYDFDMDKNSMILF